MSERLWRAVALGPGGVGSEQRYSTNRRRFAETGTAWVRLWADWPTVQPDATRAPDMAALDDQIDQARVDGLRVMVTAWRFPRWANGTATLTQDADASYALADRVVSGGDPARRKDLTFKLPDDLSPRGDWGQWIDFLIARYASRIDALEITNEPNLQLWPQQDATGSLTIDSAVATMMETAATLAARRAQAPLLVAPATADPVGDSRLRTGYDTFTRELLARLGGRGFDPGARFAWSHHNYTDVENDLGGAANRVAQVRAMLEGRWGGWPAGDAADPGILVTESGARIGKVAKNRGISDAGAARLAQGEVVERNLRRMYLGPEGTGVAMVCQYLFVTDINYDSGLCDLDGTSRPAYYAWAQLPTLR